MLRFLFILLLAVAASAQVPEGVAKQQVIDQLGWPKSSSKNGDKEILNYPDFTILLIDGKVDKVTHKPAAALRTPRPAAPVSPVRQPRAVEPSRVPAPEEILGPVPNRAEDIRPTLQATPSAARRSAVTPLPPTDPVTPSPPPRRPVAPPRTVPDPFAVWRGMVLWLLVAFASVVALKLWFKANPRKQRPDPYFESGGMWDSTQGSPPLLSAFNAKPAERSRPDFLKSGWSLELLRQIEWHRFEHLVAAYERELGNDAELTTFGADGGVDIEVFAPGERTPKHIIQCKAHSKWIGVDLVRAFYGVIMLKKMSKGAFYTTSTFTDDAQAIGLQNPELELVDGPAFLNRIQRLTLPAKMRLFEVATEGDYTTPTCASCGVKMVLRTAGKGRSEGSGFWGCRNYPRCQSKLNLPAS